VRRLAHGLGPTTLEELGLAAAIERLCEDFESSSGLHVALKSDAELATRLEPGTARALYRIAQEALSNVVRHAAASRVDVALVRRGRWIQLTIRDDGRGFGADGARATARKDVGFGLGSIRERALMLGGELTVRTLSGQGTTIGVRIPVSS
jgi:signal transduction histidine kinase